ncbi:antibiotic biosynthesis monooxygenase [Microbulbifer sp. OS29]|uniref:Antibiotic biosynthesis monooxygenase n=1 Tax=Microbulbifer okhotskensis TaxID=2926617 RepID=A0A9X2ETQ1_9GAMM|nr:antibiotic biosynthesis monooxygenase [Microbulbifer okhotskensis]MCO1335663.1 antibiotic biosynthesis monooxygenase [Microbulbifer okhotskensis]
MTEAKLAIVVLIDAKVDKADEVKALLNSALPLAMEEYGTISWYAVQINTTQFAIFDTFNSEESLTAHLNGKIATALLGKADELLSSAPQIMTADILAAKV